MSSSTHVAERRSWASARQRCTNSNLPAWPRYGGRGITFCERWNNFANFLEDMGPRPPGTSLDRINNDGNYEPGNCRWATRQEQQSNRANNVKFEYQGIVDTKEGWARRIGTSVAAMDWYLKRGESPQQVIERISHFVKYRRDTLDTHCRNGHPYSRETTFVRTHKEGYKTRSCLLCRPRKKPLAPEEIYPDNFTSKRLS